MAVFKVVDLWILVISLMLGVWCVRVGVVVVVRVAAVVVALVLFNLWVVVVCPVNSLNRAWGTG